MASSFAQGTWTSIIYKNKNSNYDNVLPNKRRGHSAIQFADNIVVFGGFCEACVPLNDVWQFNITTCTWIQLNCWGTIPSPRYEHSAIYLNNNMVIFGGQTLVGKSAGVFMLNLTTNEWTCCYNDSSATNSVQSLNGPAAISGHSMIPFAPKQRNTMQDTTGTNESVATALSDYGFLIFGGRNGSWVSNNDCYYFNIKRSTWHKLNCKGSKPIKRTTHTSVYHQPSNSMVVFAGYDDGGQFLGRRNDSFLLNLTTLTWHELNCKAYNNIERNMPCEISNHTAILLPANINDSHESSFDIKMVVFGGWDHAKITKNDVYLLQIRHNADSSSNQFEATWIRINCTAVVNQPLQLMDANEASKSLAILPTPRRSHIGLFIPKVSHKILKQKATTTTTPTSNSSDSAMMLIFGGYSKNFFNDIHLLSCDYLLQLDLLNTTTTNLRTSALELQHSDVVMENIDLTAPLDDDILLQILSHCCDPVTLKNVSLTSKRLYTMCKCNAIWAKAVDRLWHTSSNTSTRVEVLKHTNYSNIPSDNNNNNSSLTFSSWIYAQMPWLSCDSILEHIEQYYCNTSQKVRWKEECKHLVSLQTAVNRITESQPNLLGVFQLFYFNEQWRYNNQRNSQPIVSSVQLLQSYIPQLRVYFTILRTNFKEYPLVNAIVLQLINSQESCANKVQYDLFTQIIASPLQYPQPEINMAVDGSSLYFPLLGTRVSKISSAIQVSQAIAQLYCATSPNNLATSNSKICENKANGNVITIAIALTVCMSEQSKAQCFGTLRFEWHATSISQCCVLLKVTLLK